MMPLGPVVVFYFSSSVSIKSSNIYIDNVGRKKYN